MNGKKCEVCSRKIKTGRKYCFEHRYTHVENYDRIIDKITKDYINRMEFIIEEKVPREETEKEEKIRGEARKKNLVWDVSDKELDGELEDRIKNRIHEEKLKVLESISKKEPKYIDFIKHQLKLKKEAKEFNKSFF